MQERKRTILTQGTLTQAEDKIETVERTACCGSEGGKKVVGRCCLCGMRDPKMIWMALANTKCVTQTETRRMCSPRRIPKGGGYVPFAVRNGATQYASTGTGSAWCAGKDGNKPDENQNAPLEGVGAAAVA